MAVVNKSEFEQQFQRVEAEPIEAGAAPAPSKKQGYFAATLPLSVQLEPDLVKNRFPNVPSTRLMPFQANASQGINSAAQGIADSTINTSTPVTVTGSLVYKGQWLNFANYAINNVVLENESAYVALQSSTNVQPGTNTAIWQLISENLVFNPTLTGQGVDGFGPADGNIQVQGFETDVIVGPLTPSAAGDLAILGTSANGANLSGGWIDEIIGGETGLFFIKSLSSGATLSENLGLFSTGEWTTNLLLFQSNGQPLTATITGVAVASNVVTVQCVNTFLAGTNVRFPNGMTATFLDNQTITITAATPTSFSAAFSHTDYGPAADSGTVTNLMWLQQATILHGGLFGTTTFNTAFANNVRKGSLIVIPFLTADWNASGKFNSVSDSQGNTYIIKNNTTTGATSMAWTFTSAAGPLTTTCNVTGTTSFSWMYQYEFPGGGSSFHYDFVPYDVQEFRGSMFVCLTATTGDAFADPSSWALLAQGTGYVDTETDPKPEN